MSNSGKFINEDYVPATTLMELDLLLKKRISEGGFTKSQAWLIAEEETNKYVQWLVNSGMIYQIDASKMGKKILANIEIS